MQRVQPLASKTQIAKRTQALATEAAALRSAFEKLRTATNPGHEAGLVAGETVELGGQLGVIEDVEVALGGGG